MVIPPWFGYYNWEVTFNAHPMQSLGLNASFITFIRRDMTVCGNVYFASGQALKSKTCEPYNYSCPLFLCLDVAHPLPPHVYGAPHYRCSPRQTDQANLYANLPRTLDGPYCDWGLRTAVYREVCNNRVRHANGLSVIPRRTTAPKQLITRDEALAFPWSQRYNPSNQHKSLTNGEWHSCVVFSPAQWNP
jgi:hypothetical protein